MGCKIKTIPVLFLVIGSGAMPAYADALPSPLQQFNQGVQLWQIQCNDSKILLESPDGRPACASADTAERLKDMGYATIISSDRTVADPTLSVPKTDEKTPADENTGLDEGKKPNISSNGSARQDTADGDMEDQAPPVQESQEEPTESQTLILNPQNLTGIVLQDVTFDYVLNTHEIDRDEFAQRMVLLADDKIIGIHSDGSIYDTEKGVMRFHNIDAHNYALSYELVGVGSIDPNRAEEFASDLLKELGATPDGTEIFSEGSDRGYALKIVQRYDGLKIPTNVITIDFGATRT